MNNEKGQENEEYYEIGEPYTYKDERKRIPERIREGGERKSTRRMLLMIGIPALIVLLVGAFLLQITRHSNTSTAKLTPRVLLTPTPTPAPSPTVTHAHVPGTVLCDGAVSGWDGWTASPEWTVQNGILSSAGTSADPVLLLTPCKFGVDDVTSYVVEANIQVASTTPGGDSMPCFHIDPQGFDYRLDHIPMWAGHKVAINCTGDNTIQLIRADMDTLAPDGKVEAQAAFDPAFLYHTYRIEIREFNLRIFVDGELLFDYTDSVALAGRVAFDSYHTQVNISSFRVIAL